MNWQCLEAFVALGSIAPDKLDNLVTFYTRLLGQKPQPHQPGTYAEFRLPGLRLAIFLPKIDRQTEFQQTKAGSMSICIQVQSLTEVIEDLEIMAHPVSNIITASHGRELYTYDPDGNRLIFYQPSNLDLDLI